MVKKDLRKAMDEKKLIIILKRILGEGYLLGFIYNNLAVYKASDPR